MGPDHVVLSVLLSMIALITIPTTLSLNRPDPVFPGKKLKKRKKKQIRPGQPGDLMIAIDPPKGNKGDLALAEVGGSLQIVKNPCTHCQGSGREPK